MLLPSASIQDDFLAAPELLRLTTARCSVEDEPALLIKCITLNLKYIVQSHLPLHFLPVASRGLLYVLEIDDGTADRAALGSLMELEEEQRCLRRLLDFPVLGMFLFNELAVNVAWTRTDLGVIPASIGRLICNSERQMGAANKLRGEIDSRIDSICAGEVNTEWTISFQKDLTWTPVHVHRFTNEHRVINTSLWDSDEGGQQEELAVWITEGLLRGLPAFRSPQVHEFSGVRELTDVLITDGLLSLLIESKALSVFARPKLPARSKLANDLVKHVWKASKQLAGAAKNVQRGLRITDSNAREIVIGRDRPVSIFHPDHEGAWRLG